MGGFARTGLLVLLAVLGTAAAAGRVLELSADRDTNVVSVTLDGTRALVVREARVPLSAEERENGDSVRLKIVGLSSHVVNNSLLAWAEGGASVGYLTLDADGGRDPRVLEEIREQRAAIDARASARQRQRKLGRHERDLVQSYAASLATATATAKLEAPVGADAMRAALDLMLERTAGVDAAIAETEAADAADSELREALWEQERELNSGAATVELHADGEGDGEVVVRIAYQTRKVRWAPQYRLWHSADSVNVDYQAVLHQETGERWEDCSLRVSTAPRSRQGGPAPLSPESIGMHNLPGAHHHHQHRSEYATTTSAKMASFATAASAEFSMFDDDGVGAMAGDIRGRGGAAAADGYFDEDCADGYGGAAPPRAAVAFAVPGRSTLESGAAAQTVKLAEVSMPIASQRRRIVPATGDAAYFAVTVQLPDDALPWLASSDVSILRDGVMVAHSSVPDVQPGEEVELLLGEDAAVRATVPPRTEVQDRDAGLLGMGGTKSTTTRQPVTVRNLGTAAVNVTAEHSLPTATDTRIKIKADHDDSLLWKVLEPGEEADLSFTFSVTWPAQ